MTEPATLAATDLVALAAPAASEDVGRYVTHFGDLRTGQLWGTLPCSALAWTSELRETGDLRSTIPAGPEATGLWEALQAGRAMVAVEWARSFSRRILFASPVVARDLGETSLTVGGSGMFGHLGRRLLLPNVAASAIATAPGMTFTGDMGTIMAKALAQVLGLDEGDLPVVLEAYRSGTRTQTYFGYEMAPVAQRISELAQHINGPDFALLPRFADGPDYTHLVWDFITGTETAPQLNRTAAQPIVVDGTAPGQTTVKGVSWSETVSGMGTHAFAQGAQADKATIIRGATDTTLTGQGWPRVDVVTTNDSKDAATVQAYADGSLAQAKRPLRGITVRVDAAFWWAQDARLGDSVRVMFDHPIAGRIDLTSRLLSESAEIVTSEVQIELADTLAEDVT